MVPTAAPATCHIGPLDRDETQGYVEHRLKQAGSTDKPSWGQMISDATPNFSTAWWYMLFPGIALVLTVLAFNFVGDAMQDALNPRKRRS